MGKDGKAEESAGTVSDLGKFRGFGIAAAITWATRIR